MSDYQKIDCVKCKGKTIKLPFTVAVDINPLDIDKCSSYWSQQKTRELILVNIIEELVKTFKEKTEVEE